MHIKWKLALILFGVVLVIVVGIAGYGSYQQLKSAQQTKTRESRILLLRSAESFGDDPLARALLSDLVRDFPENSEVLSLFKEETSRYADQLAIQKQEQESSDRRRMSVSLRLERLRSQMNNSVGLQSKVVSQVQSLTQSTQQRWAELDSAQKLQAIQQQTRTSEDYLYRIFKEKPAATPDTSQMVIHLIQEGIRDTQIQDWSAAISSARQALKSDPSNAKAATLWLYATANEYPELTDPSAELVPLAETLLQILPDNFFALYADGVLFQNSGKWTLAKDRFQKAVEVEPQSWNAQAGLIRVLLHLGQTDEAHTRALALWQQGPQDDRTGLVVWSTFQLLSDDARLAFLSDWRTVSPQSPLPDIYEGDLKASGNDPKAAVVAYQAAVQKRPNLAVMQKLADAYAAADDPANASRIYRQIWSQSNPNVSHDADTYRRVGKGLLASETKIRDWNDVAADGMDYLNNVPHEVEVRLEVGKAYIALRDLAKARDILETGAHDISGFVLLDDLLNTYYALKQWDAARKKVADAMTWPLTDDQKKWIVTWKNRIDTGSKTK